MSITSERPLVLGSASPRRRELLGLASLPFTVRVGDADERLLPGDTPASYLARVTRAKLDAVRALEVGRCAGILVADTVVVADGEAILGKPRDPGDAAAMIERLSGTTHRVMTRFLLAAVAADTEPAHAETVVTSVGFRRVEADEVRAYVASGEGADKAGGYAVQGRAAVFVQRIEGSYSNVVGLPLCEVVVALRALGWLQGS